MKNMDNEAFDLLRTVVTMSKNGVNGVCYKSELSKLQAILPKAPGVKAACDAWLKRASKAT